MATKQGPVFLCLNPEFPLKIMTLVQEQNIKMVYWDLGGTLVDFSRDMKERAVKKINTNYHRNISVEMYEQAIRTEWMRRETPKAKKVIKSVDDDLKERMYWIEFYICVLRNLGIRVKNNQIAKRLATVQQNPESFEELPYVRETLAKLREINIPAGIISNAFPSAREILKKSGLIQEFDEQHVILSCEYNSIKPEIDIYLEAIDRARVKPHEILFIDDRKSFVDGATKHGMKTVVISSTEGQDNNGSGESETGIIEQLEKRLFKVIWFWNRWIKGIKNRSARFKTGFLWQQRAQRYIEFLSLRRGT